MTDPVLPNAVGQADVDDTLSSWQHSNATLVEVPGGRTFRFPACGWRVEDGLLLILVAANQGDERVVATFSVWNGVRLDGIGSVGVTQD